LAADTGTLREGALDVLRLNDLGRWTKPAPRLYPHQWSWDSAFIAIGLAHVDLNRALLELESLFEAQWSDGRVPHIVFNPAAKDYFPGPDRWASAAVSERAPREPATSGLVQPPVHALALQRIAVVAAGHAGILERTRQLYPRMLEWHRYLATSRDPERSGLITIYHPWESGTDNSPRWDDALGRVDVGEVPPYQRHDLKHVADPSERPTQAEYDRYLWLVESLKDAHYDDELIHRSHPFLIRDVLMTAIFAAANEALREVGVLLGRPAAELDNLDEWGQRASAAVQGAWDPAERLALDWDVRQGGPVRVRTCAGLAPLLLSDLPAAMLGDLLEVLHGTSFAGAEGQAFAVVPSTAPGSPGYRPRTYWRGPVWPIVNWLLWWGLRRNGRPDVARRLRAANLALLETPGARFAEYFEPKTGEALGSLDQSWTAAVALDWLATND
jgi:glucosylglycerate hydrolase